MGKKFNDELKYLCKVNVLFTYMEKEIESAINNKLDLATDFYILYRGVEYHLDIWVNYNGTKIEPRISLNNQLYSSMDEFKENAKLGEILIKDIKDILEIALIYYDSVYLEENEVSANDSINENEFKYSKMFINTFLFCGIFLTLFAVVSRWMFEGQSGNTVGFIFFDSIAIFEIFVYLY